MHGNRLRTPKLWGPRKYIAPELELHAPAQWREAISDAISCDESKIPIYRPSPRARDKCLRVRRVRRCRGIGSRRTRRVGGNVALARARRKTRACLDDSLAQFARTLLRAIHFSPRISTL